MALVATATFRLIWLACFVRSQGILPPCELEDLPSAGNCFLQTEAMLQDRVAHSSQSKLSLKSTYLELNTASLAEKLREHTFGGAPYWAWIYGLSCCTIGPVSLMLVSLLFPLKSEEAGRQKAEKVPEAARYSRAGSGKLPKDHKAYFDLWRIMCVCVMVISHAGKAFESYVEYNMMAGQQWVLPVIMLISGTCYCMSSLTWPHYTARLLLYFSVGNLLNWAAAMVTGTHWWESITTRGMTFQMFFVLGLAGLTVAVSPLKARLSSGSDAARIGRLSVASAVYFVVFCGFATAYYLGDWPRDSAELQMLRVLTESTATLLLASAALDLLAVEHQDLIGWLLLAWIYTTRIWHAEPRPGAEVHLGDLFTFAVFVHRVPLRWSAEVGLACAQLCFVIVFICAFLLHPGLRARLDLEPSEYVLSRLRDYSVEIVVVVAFTTVPTAGPSRTIPLPDALRRHLPWANKWALFAYCAHYAIYRLVLGPQWSGIESTPLGVMLVFASASLFVAADLLQQPKEAEACKVLQAQS